MHRSPTYLVYLHIHQNVTVDDALMGITHVVRAEEHLTNTLRQCLILEALKYPQVGLGLGYICLCANICMVSALLVPSGGWVDGRRHRHLHDRDVTLLFAPLHSHACMHIHYQYNSRSTPTAR